MHFSPTPSAEFENEVFPHMRTLFTVGLRLTRDPDDAHDLVQDTLLRALGAWERFAKGSNCRAWLIRILTNSYISRYRRGVRDRAYERSHEAAGDGCSEPDVEVSVFEAALSDEVVEALSGLPWEFRQVVSLCDLEGLSYRETARRIGCPIGTVMSRLFRARRILEDRLSPLARESGILRPAA